MSMRIGYGYDSHEFKAGVPLVIGGVKLEHTHGLAGHSDGDVLLHAKSVNHGLHFSFDVCYSHQQFCRIKISLQSYLICRGFPGHLR